MYTFRVNPVDSTRASILAAFDKANGQVLNGAALAAAIGLSRGSIWKHMRALKEFGFPIRSLARNGYRFNGTADASLWRWKAPRSLSRWLTPHRAFHSASTQSEAKRAAVQGAPEGHLWISETQSAGRGRLDRAWSSPYGGIWFSLILKPKLAASEVPPLTLVAALAMVNAIETTVSVAARLKWPNDVVVYRGGRWRKVAGILTEMAGETDRAHWVVLGVGLNVFNKLPAPLRRVGVSLGELTNAPLDRARLLAAFLKRFKSDYDRYMRERFYPFQKAYWEKYSRPDAPLTLATARGTRAGIARGVDLRGGLLVESARKTSTVFEGEIVL